MNARTLAILLLVLPFPTLAAAGTPEGPDEEGVWTLRFQVDHVGSVTGRLDVRREDADGIREGTRELGTLTFSGPSVHEVDFLPAEGSGHYIVRLVLDDASVDETAFDVDDAGASRSITFDVPDAPTYLNLTSDSVNAEGKTKSPGDALITRATLSDANGLAELDGVLWIVTHDNVSVDAGSIANSFAPDATSAPIELRYDRSPIAAGDYALTFQAQKGGGPVASVTRTFQIREVAPTFVSGWIPNVTPDEEIFIDATLVLADRNGPVGPAAPEARVYRGSTRVEGAGFEAALGAPTRAADAEGAARWAYPLALRVPALASPGAHRVSIYANGDLLGTVPFDVLALPTLRSVIPTAQEGRLRLSVNGTGEGVLAARLDDGHGGATMVTVPTGTPGITLEAPRRGVPLVWSLVLRAREGGAVLAERNGTWTAPFDGPEIALTPLHVRPRLPALWALTSDGWDTSAATARVTFTRWDGLAEPAIEARVSGDRVRIDARADLAAGRYHARMELTWPNGSASEAIWSFDAGPWTQLTLGEPSVDGRNATISLQNSGGLAVTRIVVEAAPTARVSMRIGGQTITPTAVHGRSALSGFTLAPGADAILDVQLPAGPLPAGTRTVALRVLARVEIG